MSRVCLTFILSWLLLAMSASSQSNMVLLLSQPGDYIGQGRPYATINTADFTIGFDSLYGSPPDILVTAFGYWMYFSGPGGAPLTVGTYTNASRVPFNGNDPGIAVFGNSRGCNDICGSFQILELGKDGSGNINHLWLTFTQVCECFLPPLTGEIRYHSQLAPPPPSPRTLRVPVNYPTIQAALDDASLFASDTVLVDPGTYHESLDFEGKPVHLFSAGGPAVTFIVSKSNSTGISLIHGESTNSVVSGFTILNAGGGISISGSSATIVSNVIAHCGVGISCNFASAVIRNNLIISCSGYGLDLGGGASALIEGNRILTNGGAINMNYAGSPTIINNLIQGNGEGIDMENQSDADIIQNLILDNTGNGIWSLVPYGARGPYIINNTIVGNGGSGINSYGFHSNSKILNNIVSGKPALAIGTYANEPPPTIESNDFISPTGDIYEGGTITNLDGVAGNISAEPLFACPSSGDYRLRLLRSPCIDAGKNVVTQLPENDFNGDARRVNGHASGPGIVDMGAYEFSPFQQVVSCPMVSGPTGFTVECGTPAKVSVVVGESNGDVLTVLWKVNSSAVQTNAVPFSDPPANSGLSYTADLPLGANLVEVAVTDSLQNRATWLTVVTVVDKTMPLLDCPNVTVDSKDGAGELVFYAPKATDHCSGALEVSCSPASGSFFDAGVTTVLCSATDSSGNTSQSSFTVSVLRAREVGLDIVGKLFALRAKMSAGQVGLLDQAIADLNRALDSHLWTDEMHPKLLDGSKVFASERRAILAIRVLMDHSLSQSSKTILQRCLDRIVKRDRLLVSTEISTISPVVNSSKFSIIAQRELSKGDASAANHQAVNAIIHYQNAWNAAAQIRLHQN